MYKKFDLFFGVFVIVVFTWFAYVLLSSAFNFSITTYNLRASFSSADGIMKGSEIKIAGVKVGEVTSIEADPKTFTATVEMKVYDKFKIPLDSTASIQSSGLLGGKYIEIIPGAEDKNLKNGQKIKITQSSINLEKLVSTFAAGGGKKSE